MGWSPAPGVFTKFIRQVLAALRYPNRIHSPDWLIKRHYADLAPYYVSAFLDDILGLGVGSYRTNLLVTCVLEMFTRLALLYHVHKCELRAKKKIEHLGFTVNVENHTFELSDK